MEKQVSIDLALENLEINKIIHASLEASIGRFEDAVKKANPQLNKSHMETYKNLFFEQLPSLMSLALSESKGTIIENTPDDELKILFYYSNQDNIVKFIEILSKITINVYTATEKVMRIEGVAAHKKSLEQAINTM